MEPQDTPKKYQEGWTVAEWRPGKEPFWIGINLSLAEVIKLPPITGM